MPIVTSIDGATGFRTHVVTGTVLMVEVRDEMSRTYGRADYRSEADTLWDLRKADLGKLSRSDVKGLVDYVLKHRGAPPGARTVFVVSRDLDFGIARMYEQRLEAASPSDVLVTRDMDEALAWLAEAPTE